MESESAEDTAKAFEKIWAQVHAAPSGAVILSGVPLSGKSTSLRDLPGSIGGGTFDATNKADSAEQPPPAGE